MLAGEAHNVCTDNTLSGNKRERSKSATDDKDTEKKNKIQSRESFTITLMDVAKDKMFFKVNKKTKISKIISVYAERKGGMHPASLIFLFNGENIGRFDRTMEEIGIQNQDVINVLFQTIGWCMADSKDLCEEVSATDKDREKKCEIQSKESSFIISLMDETDENMYFKVNSKTSLAKIRYEYATRKELYAPALRFRFNGEKIDNIHSRTTMEEIGVTKDESLIEVTEISGLPI